MDSGEGGLSEPARAALAGDYPGWDVWRNGALGYARRLKQSPPPVLRAASYKILRGQLTAYEAMYDVYRDMGRALDAAQILQTPAQVEVFEAVYAKHEDVQRALDAAELLQN